MSGVLDKGARFRFRARGQSMAPFVRDGDVITIAALPPQIAPSLGDVVAFLHPASGNVVVHRIVATDAEGYRILGDRLLLSEEEFVPRKNLLGRVVRVERNGRTRRLGLGPERLMIAWLSRTGQLAAMSAWLGACLRAVRRRR